MADEVIHDRKTPLQEAAIKAQLEGLSAAVTQALRDAVKQAQMRLHELDLDKAQVENALIVAKQALKDAIAAAVAGGVVLEPATPAEPVAVTPTAAAPRPASTAVPRGR